MKLIDNCKNHFVDSVRREIPRLAALLEDKTLFNLEQKGIFVFPELIKDAEDLTGDQIVLQKVDDYYCTGNVMGYLGCGSEQMTISSRFSEGETDFLFQYLLEKVLDIPNIFNLHVQINQKERVQDLLIFLFPMYLRKAMRKGIYKTYINRNYNSANVRGRINVECHIKQNTPFTGKVAYSQREFSYDNNLMELIRHTIEFVKTKSYHLAIASKIREEASSVIEVTKGYNFYDRRKIVLENKQNPVRHAYYREYRQLQLLCIMILQYDRHQFGEGSKEVNGILFDGAWLWEEYINLLIKDSFYHPQNKGGKGAQRLFLSASSGRQLGLIYPDFISRDCTNRIIADAKYKPIENIGNRDYLQVLAYMFRFDASRGFYLYPENGEKHIEKFNLQKGTTYEKNVTTREEIEVKKIGLLIPRNCERYSEFVDLIKVNEKIFISEILDE